MTTSLPPAALAASYATNVLSIKLGALSCFIEPLANGVGEIDAVPRSARSRFPLHLVSAWNPEGAPTTLEGNLLHHARLVAAVAKRTHDHLGGTLIGDASHWYEQVVAISGYTDARALALGRRFKQSAVIRIDEAGWHIMPTGLHQDVEFVSLGWRLREAGTPACAMKALAEHADRCTMVGGPYGSAAMSAGGDWVQRRRVAATLLGCRQCETRPVEPAEQGLILNPDKEWCVASRHGKAIVRDKRRRKYFIQAGVIGDDFPGLEQQ